MAKPFNTTVAGRVNIDLPALTKQQIKALMSDLDMDARDVVIRAVAELWGREIGPASERDVLAELDELKAAMARLDRIAAE